MRADNKEFSCEGMERRSPQGIIGNADFYFCDQLLHKLSSVQEKRDSCAFIAKNLVGLSFLAA